MVGLMSGSEKEEISRILHSIKISMDIASKLQRLDQLKEVLVHKDPSFVSEFVPRLVELKSDRFSPIRKSLAGTIGEIGLECTEVLPEMVPVLIAFLKDDTPAVARQAITSGTDLFRCTLEKVAIQGLHSSKLDDSLKSSWISMLKFKETIYPIAFQSGSDGIRLLAVKFVEAAILLYTPDPNGSSVSPPSQVSEENTVEFNISWLRGGHPVLSVGDLSNEASQSLGLLLDQLRSPRVKSLSNSIIIVLINSLSAIAKKRPAFYGRILPVLLSLDPSPSFIKGVRVCGVHHVLKNAFLSCLRCTHPGAAPWRDRLVGALKEMKAGHLAEQAVQQVVKITGSVEDEKNVFYSLQEEKPLLKACDAEDIGTGRKRSLVQDSSMVQDDDVSAKRARTTPTVSEASDGDARSSLISSTSSSGDEDTGPVQQLVAMFGALVAQGEKAAASLEILISSISSDLLAEVVMANIRYLPPTPPKYEEDEESAPKTCSLSTIFPYMASLLGAQPSVSDIITRHQLEDGHQAESLSDTVLVHGGVNNVTEETISFDIPDPSIVDNRAFLSNIHDIGTLESGIPGLDSTVRSDEISETRDTCHSASIDFHEENDEQVTSMDTQELASSGSMSIDRSEELSSKVVVSDANSLASTPTSVVILPKMSAPVIVLTDDQKDHLQKSAFMRIIESYKQISVAGGTHLRFSLLPSLGVEYPLELDAWKHLQEHIFSDYFHHEGHELTLRVLNRLYGEAEKEHDFFSSTTATSVYETFLLTAAETLRDLFPASDKSLSRLLGEVPYIPKSTFKLLEDLCSPGRGEIVDKEVQSGDRVTQGLSAVWSLILLRPPIRDVCLKIALQSAVHQLEEVRMKAIRLVANKLYPISSITQQIEDFASEMLLTVLESTETVDAERSPIEVQKDSDLEKPLEEQPLTSIAPMEVFSDTPSKSPSSIPETQRCMSLYFALCTKKHSLFRKFFVIYKSIPENVTEAVHRHIPILVRAIGSSSELLAIISDPPNGSKSLLMQVLHILTDGTVPSTDLIFTVKRLYESKLKDIEILLPILPFLPKDEVLAKFPELLNLPVDKFQAALTRMLQGSSHSSSVLSPAEVLIAIHGIDPERDSIPLKKVTDACNACFEQRQVFTQQVIAKVLNQLVEQIPLPLLFMRTVLQAIGAYPALVDFILEILSRLVTKQIWKYPKLWVGFLKCAQLTKPESFSVLLQLPAAQLENALNRIAALKAPLIAHANQPNIRSSLPSVSAFSDEGTWILLFRSTLVILGIVSDTQISSQASHISSQAQTSTAQVEDSSNSGTDGNTEMTKESTNAC
ncbi:hypothetical protein GIB67_027506 [Kingdonia uniflora]|uniref:Symplekin n=1 Tax=Kingdonia uniflora TaxID=39325 RepID=A0A7J7MFE1_9MAGN|nr:hypothetical protein GIB67_027506 [Kingdonia uniflora]